MTEKLCRDRVDRLKRKMFVAIRKILSRHILEAEGHEKLVANRFGVATQDILVATRTRLLHQNFVVTLSKFVMTESKKELRNQVATENNMLRQRPLTKTENSVAIEISMLRQSDQFEPEFWGSTTQLLKCGPTLESL